VLTAWLHAWELQTGPRAKGLVLEEAGRGPRNEDRNRRAGTGPELKSPVGAGGACTALGVWGNEVEANPEELEWAHSWWWLGTHDGSREAVESRIRTEAPADGGGFKASGTGVLPSSTCLVSIDGRPIGEETRSQVSPSEAKHIVKTAHQVSKVDQSGEVVPQDSISKGAQSQEAFPRVSKSRAEHSGRATEKDDQRYLAVTAFSTGAFGDGTLVCYVVTASADSKLVLRAFHPHSRTWHLLAELDHHKCPVLSLDCITHPLTESRQPSYTPQNDSDKDSTLNPSSNPKDALSEAFFVFSGATDGSIAFWDVSRPVQSFRATWRERVAEVSDQGGNSRPPTGRGSAGGGGWRRLTGPRMSKRKKNKLAKAAASIPEGQGIDLESGFVLRGGTEAGGNDDTGDIRRCPSGSNEDSLCQEALDRELVDEGRGVASAGEGLHYVKEGQRTKPPFGSGSPDKPLTGPPGTVNNMPREGTASTAPRGIAGDGPKADVNSESDSRVENQPKGPLHIVAKVAPVLVIEGAHQSGVNGLSVAVSGADMSVDRADVAVSVADVEEGSTKVGRSPLGRSRSYVVLSGGDDQAIHAVDFRVEENVQGAVEVRVTRKGSLQLAHSSAIKGEVLCEHLLVRE
jgi:hypothetical protein